MFNLFEKQVIASFVNLIDKMDTYTGEHSRQVAVIATNFAKKLNLSQQETNIIHTSALLHDIGKIGCSINLNKPGKFTSEEFEIFKRHPLHGKEILQPISFLEPVIPGIISHHESWNGDGYPMRLCGTDIPFIARVITLADTWDAMTSNRVYHLAASKSIAIAEIRRCSGIQFDPQLVEPFIEIMNL